MLYYYHLILYQNVQNPESHWCYSEETPEFCFPPDAYIMISYGKEVNLSTLIHRWLVITSILHKIIDYFKQKSRSKTSEYPYAMLRCRSGL